MKSDEKYIEGRFGKQNHFTVPEGYLQNLAASVMANVGNVSGGETPQKETVKPAVVVMLPWWRRTRVRIAAAAACLLLAGSTAFYTYSSRHVEPAANYSATASSHSAEAGTQSATYNEVADYAMLDNDDIYSLLASN